MFFSISLKDDGNCDQTFKVLNKRISVLKRKIKKFEDGFEDENGYRVFFFTIMAYSAYDLDVYHNLCLWSFLIFISHHTPRKCAVVISRNTCPTW